jgi:integrative and conjugative element protein (TIGR02256 family)
MKDRIFYRSGGGYLKLSGRTVATMLRFRQLRPEQEEAGGIVLGRFLRDAPNVIIDAVTTPRKHDQRNRFTFFRSVSHQETLDQAWHASAGTTVYLGEWHTHPEPIPHPSGRDFRSWHDLLEHPSIPNDALFFVIVGQSALKVWEGAGDRIAALKEVTHV